LTGLNPVTDNDDFQIRS